MIIAVGIASSVSACGGGGSVGGSISRLPITITNPDPGVVIEPSALELTNTPSLGDVAAASVYHLGVSGEGMTIGVVDSGVDKTHEELAGWVISRAVEMAQMTHMAMAPMLPASSPHHQTIRGCKASRLWQKLCPIAF